jgi:hypothetical protein
MNYDNLQKWPTHCFSEVSEAVKTMTKNADTKGTKASKLDLQRETVRNLRVKASIRTGVIPCVASNTGRCIVATGNISCTVSG